MIWKVHFRATIKHRNHSVSSKGQDQRRHAGISLLLSFPENSFPLSVGSATSIATFKKHLKERILTWPFPYSHQHARWPFKVLYCFMDFAVEHSFGCPATAPSLTGGIEM